MTPTRQILMIDDSPTDVRLVAEALEESGIQHRLRAARTGEEALRFLRRIGEHSKAGRPDLILLDLNLPGMSGRQVLSELKNDADLHSIPVVVLTTSGAELDVRQSYRVHANGYVIKPIGFPQMCDTMRIIADFWLRVATLPRSPEAI